MIMEIFTKGPLARAIATMIVEKLIAYGYIKQGDTSDAVRDTLTIIDFVVTLLILLIWQWRAHHPAKAQVDITMPITEDEALNVEKSQRRLKDILDTVAKKVVGKFIEKKPQQ